MKKQVKSIISLFSICAVIAILLALTNALTYPIIKENDDKKANQSLLVVLPDGKNFTKQDTSKYGELPKTIVEVYSEENGGYVFKMVTSGYSSNLVIMCGIRADGTVSKAICLSSNETLGAEEAYGDKLKDASFDTIDSIDTVSGATKTTAAFRSAVKDALSAFKKLNGEEVDFRTEEEIFAENLSTALPSAQGKFTYLFISEEISGVDSIYTADNGSGAVYICGDSFVAVNPEGKVTSQTSDELRATVEAAAAIIKASSLTELDLSAYNNLPTALTEASVSASGNFVLTLKGAGYGITGGNQWHPASGKYIIIKISMTPEGKIINCQTISQEESKGIGDACADTDFYSQFNGKNESNYQEIDAISGATMTTNGYLNAVKRAFEAVKILKGGTEQ